MDVELKPCPFCGSDVIHHFEHSEGHESYGLQCTRCWTTGPQFGNKLDAITAWNTRPALLRDAGDGDSLRYEDYLAWRGIERDDCCPICSGAGRRAYPDTSTWRRGRVAGQQVTSDVCDHCWGSGTIIAWPSHKHYPANKRDAERYRQLRDGKGDPFGPRLVVKKFCGTFGEYEDVSWTEIEQTLDAAMHAPGGAGGGE